MVRRTRILTPLIFVFVATFLLFPGISFAQQQYYVPRQKSTLDQGQVTLGLRPELSTSSGSRRDFRLAPNAGYSPFEGFQISAEIPVVHALQRDTGPKAKSGVGDALIETRYRLLGGTDWNLMANLDVVAPTGDNPYENEVPLGSGHWRTSAGFTFFTVQDPLSAFFHMGYEYSFAETYTRPSSLSQPQNFFELLVLLAQNNQLPPGTHEFQPGESIQVRAGTTVLFNPTTRFNLFTSMDFRKPLEVDGNDHAGSASNNVRLGSGLSFTYSDHTTIDFNFIFGITSSAQSVIISPGINYSF